MLQIHNGAVNLGGVYPVAFLRERAVFFQVGRKRGIIPGNGKQTAHGAARAPPHADDPVPVPRQNLPIVPQEPDGGFQIHQADGRLSNQLAVFIPGFSAPAAAGHINKAPPQILPGIAPGAAQPGMGHLHIPGGVVLKDHRNRFRGVGAVLPLWIYSAIGMEVGPRHKNAQPLEFGYTGLGGVQHILQAPAVVLFVKRPCVPALSQIHGPVYNRNLFHYSPPVASNPFPEGRRSERADSGASVMPSQRYSSGASTSN